MERKMMVRYLIFLVILVICAGVAWYFMKSPRQPEDNAVLARIEAEFPIGEAVSHEL